MSTRSFDLPLVSIVIPNFNGERFIAETLESIENQTYRNIEVIVIDDNSTDQSVNIASRFSNRDSRFKIFVRNREPKGGAACRNIGMQHATGKYLIFIDSDDVFDRNAIGNRVDFMENKPDLSFSVFPTATFYLKPGDGVSVAVTRKADHFAEFLSHDVPWSIMQPIWTRNFLTKTNGFNEHYPRLQDVELHSRILAMKSCKYTVVRGSDADCYYRLGEQKRSISQEQLLSRMMLGYFNYADDMIKLIKSMDLNKRRSKRYIRRLRGTHFAIAKHILRRWSAGLITKRSRDEFIRTLQRDSNVQIRSSNTHIYIYAALFFVGLDRVRGIHYVAKKIFIYL